MSNVVKFTKAPLRSLGYDERWLQDRIADDPSILGLGDVYVYKRELKQRAGGRVDFVLEDRRDDTRYVVEIMLGENDPSHIVRTIEYWDLEARRYPSRRHCAVLVAEGITNRFFNVVWLLNRWIPIIAIQAEALRLDDGRVGLHFVRVLDLQPTDLDEERDESGPAKEKRALVQNVSAASLHLVDEFLALLRSKGITFDRRDRSDGIALSSGRNVVRLVPLSAAAMRFGFWANRISDELFTEFRNELASVGLILEGTAQSQSRCIVNEASYRNAADLLASITARALDANSDSSQ